MSALTMTPAELAARLGAPRRTLDAKKLVPMLCEREERGAGLTDAGHLYELKLDGVRLLAERRGATVRLAYRKLRDATSSYPEIVRALGALRAEHVVLDGEVVAFDDAGRPDFQRLATRIHGAPRAGAVPVMYVAFDVLAVDGHDLRGLPLEARKEILGLVLAGAEPAVLRDHPTFPDGAALWALCEEHGLEGVVAKRLGSTYRAGERTSDWRKIKLERDAELVVLGWTEGESSRARLGALDLGAYEGDRLVFRGRVGSGLDERVIDVLLPWLLAHEVDRPVAEGTYSPKPRRHHCRPELVVSVRYGGFTKDAAVGGSVLRFPVFRGVRPDVDPRDCTLAPEDSARRGGPR